MFENPVEQIKLLNRKAMQARERGEFAQGVQFARQACQLGKWAFGENHPHYAALLDNLALLYKVMGRYSDAKPLYYRARDIRQNLLEENHPSCATSLNNLADLYSELGRYSEAETLFIKAQNIWEANLENDYLKKNHLCYATSLNNLAWLYTAMGRFDEAEYLYYKAKDIRKAHLGENHQDYAASLHNLAVLYSELGRFSEAERFFRKAKDVWEELFGKNHPNYAASLSNLAQLYRAMGKFGEAEHLFHEAKDISQSLFGENHLNYAASLNNLAQLYRAMGKFGEAEHLFHEAKDISQGLFGENHPNYAASLNGLAAVYYAIGRYSDAENLFCKTRDFWEGLFGDKHPSYAVSLNNLAMVYYAMRRYGEAESLYHKALNISQELFGDKHFSHATCLNNLAIVYYAMGRYGEAESLYRKALNVYQELFGDKHFSYATSLNNLAELYRAMGRLSEAEPLYRKTTTILKEQLGKQHLDYAASLDNLAGLLVALNRTSEAFELMQEAVAIQNRILGEILAISSDRQRLDYLQQNYGQLEMFLSLVFQHLPNHPEAQQAAFDLVLRRKCLATEAAAFLRTAILSERYQHLAPQLEDFRQLAHAIAAVTLNVPSSPEGLAAYRTRLATLQQQQEQLERELSRQIPEMNMQSQLNRANRQAIASALPDNAVLLEFVRFNVFNFKAVKANGDKQWLPACYVVFVLKAGEPEQVTMVDLGDATEIDGLCRQFREAVSRVVPHKNRQSQPPADWKSGATSTKSRFADSNNDNLSSGTRGLDLDWGDETAVEPPITVLTTPEGKALYQRLIASLQPYLQPQQVVYLAPDGELNLLPFGVLAADESRYLMNEYELRYLSVGRDVLRFQTKIPTETTAPLIIANPDYDLQLPQPEIKPVVAPPKPPQQPQPVGNDVLLAVGILFGLVTMLVLLVTVPPVGGILLLLAGVGLVVKLHQASYPERLQAFEQKAQEYERVVTPPPPKPQPIIMPKPVTTAPVEELTRGNEDDLFTPLPGTAIEGKRVAASLQVPVYTEAQAVKSLLSSCKSPRLVHIATHGYFFAVEQPKLEDFARLSSNLHRAALVNPLTRSGLAFAGANASILGKNLPPEAEDGLMTAQGFSGLDFTGTQLVVLSACETGLGEVQTGESVGGLRRSLILAGAEAVVMSLWSVPDVPTAILMEQFYYYLLSENKGRTIALETAQADLRYLTVGQMRDRWLTEGAIAQVQQYSTDSARHLHDLRSKPNDYQPYSHPLYWSAFVCAGDASPMADCSRTPFSEVKI